MSALPQPMVPGDWLKFEEDNRYSRENKTVISGVNLPSGQVMGTESTLTTKYRTYDNSNAAAAAGILIEPFVANSLQTVTNIVVLTNVGTITFPDDQNLQVGDVLHIEGATVDTDLNAFVPVLTVPTSKTCTVTTASVANATYTEATLRVSKGDQVVALLVRGPALVNFNNVNWGASDSTGITAGTADLAVLGIVSQEGA